MLMFSDINNKLINQFLHIIAVKIMIKMSKNNLKYQKSKQKAMKSNKSKIITKVIKKNLNF